MAKPTENEKKAYQVAYRAIEQAVEVLKKAKTEISTLQDMGNPSAAISALNESLLVGMTDLQHERSWIVRFAERKSGYVESLDPVGVKDAKEEGSR